MKENKLVELSMDFAIKIIKLCETIKGHYSLVNQLERFATSIGANIREAQYAQGKKDFLQKSPFCPSGQKGLF
ncbi:MAG: four helix bundle protein [Ruminococcaceae bacterium]|nr:four helix bundle protein [Oscillospiraceae bacterium]